MKLNKRILITLSLSAFAIMLIFSSCKKSSYNKLTEEDLVWMVYKNNENLNFRNSQGQIVKFSIILRTKAYDKEGDSYNEISQANIKQLNDTSVVYPEDSKGFLTLYKSGAGLSVSLVWPHFPLDEVELTTITPSTVSINGTVYSDILLIDATVLANPRFYVSTIWYSKAFGVVQFEDIFGNTWYRIS